MRYSDGKGELTERTVRPLGLFFWGSVWSLSAWCELRDDFRDFRLDRVQEFSILESQFPVEPGKELEDFFRRMEEEEGHP